MPRTPEQIEAGDALTEAIDRLTQAYGYHEDGDINGAWVVVVEQHALAADDNDDDLSSSYAMLMKGGRLPTMTVVGMLETASFDAKLNR